MTTQHTDEKKPADGGFDAKGKELPRPMLPSSRRCVWIGPETDQGRWAVKNKMEEVLGRIDAVLWTLDRPSDEVSLERLRDSLRHFATTGMQRALELEAMLFERDPKDALRQMETLAFDSFHKR